MDTIIKSLFPTLDRLEAKVNQLEKDIQSILNAIQTSQSPKERLVLGRQHGIRNETQQRPNSETESRSTDASVVCGGEKETK
jgi:hypothetical protein